MSEQELQLRFAKADTVFGLFFDEAGIDIRTLKRTRPLVDELEALAPWLVSFSHSQQCFHIEPLASELRRNIAVCIEDRPGTYYAVALCRSHEEAHTVVGHLEAARARLKNVRESVIDEEGDGDEND